MPSRASKHPKRPRDINQLAAEIVRIATSPKEPPVPDTRNQAAVALSALGASKGGKARMASMTKKERSAVARKAAKARWRSAKKSVD